MTWPDGDSYVGDWEAGVRQGWGAYYWNNGNSYQVLYVLGCYCDHMMFSGQNSGQSDAWTGFAFQVG